MKKKQVQTGGTYVAKISGNLTEVRLDAESPHGGWDATNLTTKRRIRIKSAQKLRRAVPTETTGDPNPAQAGVPEPETEMHADVPYSDPSAYDPDRCATPRCKATPALTYQGKPLCQACWYRQCGDEPSSEVPETPGDAGRPIDEPQTEEQEDTMSKKKSSKKQTTVQSKTPKTKGGKKAATPKAKAAVATPAKTPKTGKARGSQKPGRVSALDAAAQVLKSAGKPMRAQELIDAMADKGLWRSPGGKTPHATLYAAMQREERDKGRESRFKKVDRGLFAFNG